MASSKSMSNKNVEQKGEGEKPVRSWDVNHGSFKEGPLERLTMVPAMVGKAVANIVTVPALAGGYAIGKVGESIGAGKAVDSPAFHTALKSWMLSNGIWPTVQYENSSKKDLCKTPIIVANHTSYLDGPILTSVLRGPRVVAMAGTRGIPMIGKIMEEMDTIFVDRADPNSRQATLDSIANHCSQWKTGDRPLLIFPEGTTSNGSCLLDFKKGAFLAGLPVRPVLMVYTGTWDPASTTYRLGHDGLEEMTDAEWAKQFLGHTLHQIHIRVLAPYEPSEAERSDPELYAQNCKSYMAIAHKRIQDELQGRSWKELAGRTNGGLSYQFGDVARVGLKSTASCVGVRKRSVAQTDSQPRAFQFHSADGSQ